MISSCDSGTGVSILSPKRCLVMCKTEQRPRCNEFCRAADGPDPVPKSSGTQAAPISPQNDGLNVGLWSLLSFVSCTCSHRLWFSLTNQEIVLVLTVTGPWSDPLSRWRTNWSLHWNGDAAQDFQDKSVVKVSSAVVRPSRPEVVSLKRGFIHICAFLAVSTTSVPFLCAVCVCNLFFFAGVCL